MHERERRLHAVVLQLRVVAEQLARREHALVDDRPRREARDHEVGAGGELCDAPDHVELALERLLILRELRCGGHDEMLRVRPRGAGDASDVLGVDVDVAPAHDTLALGLDRVDEELLELTAALVVVGQEAHRDSVLARGRQRLGDHAPKERVRHLQEDPGAVARVAVGARRAAVLEVLERDDRAPDGLVLRHSVQPRYERDSAGVVLVGRVVEARRPHHVLRGSHAVVDAISVEVLASSPRFTGRDARPAPYMPMA